MSSSTTSRAIVGSYFITILLLLFISFINHACDAYHAYIVEVNGYDERGGRIARTVDAGWVAVSLLSLHSSSLPIDAFIRVSCIRTCTLLCFCELILSSYIDPFIRRYMPTLTRALWSTVIHYACNIWIHLFVHMYSYLQSYLGAGGGAVSDKHTLWSGEHGLLQWHVRYTDIRSWIFVIIMMLLLMQTMTSMITLYYAAAVHVQ